MRIIKEREEIAVAINCHQMPVITIDLADADDYGLKSCKVCIETTFNDGTTHFLHSEVRAYRDENKFKFSGHCTMLKNSFGYSDIKEMLEWRNAPVVKADEDVIIAVYDSRNKIAYAPIVLHTDKRVDSFSTTPLKFIDTDYSTEVFKASVYDIFGLRKGIDSADLQSNLKTEELLKVLSKCKKVSMHDNTYEISLHQPYTYKGEIHPVVHSIEEVLNIVDNVEEDLDTWNTYIN